MFIAGLERSNVFSVNRAVTLYAGDINANPFPVFKGKGNGGYISLFFIFGNRFNYVLEIIKSIPLLRCAVDMVVQAILQAAFGPGAFESTIKPFLFKKAHKGIYIFFERLHIVRFIMFTNIGSSNPTCLE